MEIENGCNVPRKMTKREANESRQSFEGTNLQGTEANVVSKRKEFKLTCTQRIQKSSVPDCIRL